MWFSISMVAYWTAIGSYEVCKGRTQHLHLYGLAVQIWLAASWVIGSMK